MQQFQFTRRTFLAFVGAVVTAIATASESMAIARKRLSNGIDISWLPEVELAGGQFFNRARIKTDAITLLKISGVSVGRIRVFVHPQSGNGDLKRAVALAKRLKSQGLEICIDLHYSDTWADPSNQAPPSKWPKEINDLEKQIFSYTEQTLKAFTKVGITPQWVQLGNEIAGGFLWPIGKISTGEANEWRNFVRLHNSATRALRKTLPKAKSIVHLECGGDFQRVRWWLTQAYEYGLSECDVIGLSYYSQWHGSLDALGKTMNVITTEFIKPVLIVETAYPWTALRFGNDVIDVDRAALPGLAFTPSGQSKYVASIEKLLRQQPGNRGVGLWWWEGMAQQVLTPKGDIAWNGGMANSALVDVQGNALPALAALNGS